MRSPVVVGNFILTEKVALVFEGSGPPENVTMPLLTVEIHPVLVTGTGLLTPVGNLMASFVVGEVPQPCSTVKPTVAVDPVFTDLLVGAT